MDLASVARHFCSFGRDAAPDSPLDAQQCELIAEPEIGPPEFPRHR